MLKRALSKKANTCRVQEATNFTNQKLPQLRGEALKARIAVAVREHTDQMSGQIASCRVSMKAIAALVPCSRTTLHKHEEIVENALRDVGYRAARRNGNPRVEALAHRAELYKQQIDDLKAELAALRNHHADLYERLLMSSVPMGQLVRRDAVAASRCGGRCVLCGSPQPDGEPTNVVDLAGPFTKPPK